MNYLVDTNILCEPRQKSPDSKVLAWLQTHESNLYTSVLVTAEILYGIDLLPVTTGRRNDLLQWYHALLSIMAGRVLSINARVAEEWARLQAGLHKKRVKLPVVDSLLAATARRYQLILATNNIRDFRAAGVPVVNPFDL